MASQSQDIDLSGKTFAEVGELVKKYKVRRSSDPEGTLDVDFFGKPPIVFEVTHGCGHTQKVGVFDTLIATPRRYVKDCMLSELERCFDCCYE